MSSYKEIINPRTGQWNLVNVDSTGPTGPQGPTGPSGSIGPTGPTGTALVIQDITYDNLVLAITGSSLIKGQYYRVTDYKTIFGIPNTSPVVLNINSPQYVGTFEPLIIFAEDVNIISNHALSSLYPQDLLEYDYTKNLAEDSSTPRPGLIIYRKDTTLNIETHYDFRNVLFRRWQIDTTAHNPDTVLYAWNTSYTYASNDVAISPINNHLYINITGVNSADPSTDAINWAHLLNLFTYPHYFAFGVTIAQNAIVLSSDYHDFLTFNGACSDVSIGLNSLDNVFLGTCDSSSIGSYGSYSNTFGDACIFNVLGNFCYLNTFGYYTFANTFGDNCYSTTCGDYCSNVLNDGSYSNTFGDYCGPNISGQGCIGNTFGNGCLYNTFGNYCYYNIFGANTASNTFQASINTMNLSKIATTKVTFEEGTYAFTGVDFSAAILFPAVYNKTVFLNAAGNIRLRYFDTSDVLQVTNINT